MGIFGETEKGVTISHEKRECYVAGKLFQQECKKYIEQRQGRQTLSFRIFLVRYRKISILTHLNEIEFLGSYGCFLSNLILATQSMRSTWFLSFNFFSHLFSFISEFSNDNFLMVPRWLPQPLGFISFAHLQTSRVQLFSQPWNQSLQLYFYWILSHVLNPETICCGQMAKNSQDQLLRQGRSQCF